MNEIFRNNLLIVIPFSILILIGLIMISSASVFIAEANYNDPFFYISKQLIFVSMGFLAMVFFSYYPI